MLRVTCVLAVLSQTTRLVLFRTKFFSFDFSFVSPSDKRLPNWVFKGFQNILFCFSTRVTLAVVMISAGKYSIADDSAASQGKKSSKRNFLWGVVRLFSSLLKKYSSSVLSLETTTSHTSGKTAKFTTTTTTTAVTAQCFFHFLSRMGKGHGQKETSSFQ